MSIWARRMMTGELEALRAAARQRLAAGQGELDLGLPARTWVGGYLWERAGCQGSR